MSGSCFTVVFKCSLQLGYFVQRSKALFSGGCDTCPVIFVTPGGSWSRRGRDEAAEASDAGGSARDMANMQAVMRVNTGQAPKKGGAEAGPAQ